MRRPSAAKPWISSNQYRTYRLLDIAAPDAGNSGAARYLLAHMPKRLFEAQQPRFPLCPAVTPPGGRDRPSGDRRSPPHASPGHRGFAVARACSIFASRGVGTVYVPVADQTARRKSRSAPSTPSRAADLPSFLADPSPTPSRLGRNRRPSTLSATIQHTGDGLRGRFDCSRLGSGSASVLGVSSSATCTAAWTDDLGAAVELAGDQATVAPATLRLVHA